MVFTSSLLAVLVALVSAPSLQYNNYGKHANYQGCPLATKTSIIMSTSTSKGTYTNYSRDAVALAQAAKFEKRDAAPEAEPQYQTHPSTSKSASGTPTTPSTSTASTSAPSTPTTSSVSVTFTSASITLRVSSASTSASSTSIADYGKYGQYGGYQNYPASSANYGSYRRDIEAAAEPEMA